MGKLYVKMRKTNSNWLRISCTSMLWVQIPQGTVDFFMLGSYPASLWNVSGSTQMPLPALFLPPPVKLENYHIITYAVLVWGKTQPKKNPHKTNNYVNVMDTRKVMSYVHIDLRSLHGRLTILYCGNFLLLQAREYLKQFKKTFNYYKEINKHQALSFNTVRRITKQRDV